jgi:hypothetical protein
VRKPAGEMNFNYNKYPVAMSKDLRDLYRKTLPKQKKINLLDIVCLFGSLASILGIIGSLLFLQTDSVSKIYTIFLLLLIFFLIVNSIRKEIAKEHRYAQTVFFTHYANHIVRDYFSELQDDVSKISLEKTTDEILTTVAGCFSIITGKVCRACLKDLSLDQMKLTTTSRDNNSKSFKNRPDENEKLHTLAGNTDFYNLWYAKKYCLRYFFCNNLPKEWRLHRYKNTSFELYGEPSVMNLFGFSWITNWRLPYKSTIVFPIRFLKDFIPPKEGGTQVPPEWKFWGFLCVDCKSRYVFDLKYAPELGLSFADLLYTLFSQTEILLNIAERKDTNAQQS